MKGLRYAELGVALFCIAVAFTASSLVFAETATVNIEVNTLTTISVSNSPMAFALDPGVADENGTSNLPFLLDNNGTVNLDVTICATHIVWAGTTDTNLYQFIADQNEPSSCTQLDTNVWTALPYMGIAKTSLCQTFKFANASDALNVGIKIQSPTDEPTTTSTSSTVKFTVAQDTGAANQAAGTCS